MDLEAFFEGAGGAGVGFPGRLLRRGVGVGPETGGRLGEGAQGVEGLEGGAALSLRGSLTRHAGIVGACAIVR